MITAAEAREKLALLMQENKNETKAQLDKVIQSAISQGCNIANFYPKNAVQQQLAEELLIFAGYSCSLQRSTDQRDRDYIKIVW